ncbi:membrane protein [[Clostridium] sordellii]|uniref:ABC transporter permease n=1 Tax=Paraclostridium sordellii TaxID=1505 RepID=UPI0002E3E351|nr:ABC transporter permease [Paeniclostridium sordellii]CEK29775.1 membrane protein [[Clostridium] sordellii] [Paeniclostridium sordellii]
MKNPLIKDTFREIKKSKGRFISVFAIITLGVAFFTGIKVASPVMELTVDKYYDRQAFMDLTVISPLGLTDEDIKELSNIKGVKNVYPTFSKEALTSIDNKQMVLKIHGLPKSGENYINKVDIVEGHYPNSPNECLVDDYLNIPIGSTIKLYGDNNENIKDTLKRNEYKVVGKVKTPYYVSRAKGSSSIGNGQLDSFMMVLNSEFKQDVYTEGYITLKESNKINTYSDKYKDFVNKVKKEVESLGEDRSKLRYNEILNTARNDLNEGKEQLKQKRLEAYNDLNDAENRLNLAKNELTEGENDLNNKQKLFNDEISSAKSKIKDAEEQLNSNENELNKKLSEFEKNKQTFKISIKDAKNEIHIQENKAKELEEYIKSIEELLSNEYLDDNKKKELEEVLSQSKEKLDRLQSGIVLANNELQAKENLLNDTEIKLNSAKETLNNSKKDLSSKKQVLNDKESQGLNQFKEARKKISNNKKSLEKAEKEYEKNKENADEELLKAENKIKEEEDKIKEVKSGKWYVLDRYTNYGFVDFKNSADSINSISKIFPVFFFSLAALICLTTMTRMVDEQRINIGTMKALGYNQLTIMSKYILYSLTASLGGSIIGNIIGLTVFPTIIYDAYATMTYKLPKVSLQFDLYLVLISTLIAILTTTLAAIYSCYKELKEVPSTLMRPKAPKEGKRIILERITFIWNKLTFSQKVTCRNIFRYKKRFFMTIIGVAGCTALLVTGFGVKDSISSIVDNQYGHIIKYNMTLTYNKEIEKSNKSKNLDNDKRIQDYLNVKNKSIKISNGSNEKDANIIIPEDKNKINKFITLQNRVNKKVYKLEDSGVLITEKLARLLKIKSGDSITLESGENKKHIVKVNGIVENYVGHYIYMSPKLYKEIFNHQAKFNQVFTDVSTKNISESELVKDIINKENISSAAFNTTSRQSFEDMISNLNSVVILIIVSAGALAFIVLYNLTNVNISERIREIATIKVLGFYDNEVASYVFRENIILTVIGTFLGLFVGVFLHKFIMTTAELDFIMFGREIKLLSFILSALLTLIFAALVNLCMYYKLKKIKMVESLKSVD